MRTNTTYATIQQAVDAAIGGDTINVSPGTYAPFGWIGKNNLTVKSTGGPDVTLVTGSHAVIGGNWYFTGVYVGESNDARIEGFDVSCSGGNGIWVYGGSYPKESPRATIKNNVAHNCHDQGITLARAPNSLIENNKVYGNSFGGGDGMGIWISSSSTGTIVRGNEVYNNNNGSLWCAGIYASNDVMIEDNDIYGNVIGIRVMASGVQAHSNNIHGNTKYGVYSGGTYTVNAEYNWWGDVLGPGNEPGSTGNSVYGNVDYTPWLTQPIPEPVMPVMWGTGSPDWVYGTSGPSPVIFKFDTSTGVISKTLSFETSNWMQISGLADSGLYLYASHNIYDTAAGLKTHDFKIAKINRTTGAVISDTSISGFLGQTYSQVNALDFVNGKLYAVENATSGSTIRGYALEIALNANGDVIGATKGAYVGPYPDCGLDFYNGTWYATSWGYPGGGSQEGSLVYTSTDIMNTAFTQVGAGVTGIGMIDGLEFDNAGNLFGVSWYGADYSAMSVYGINTGTWIATSLYDLSSQLPISIISLDGLSEVVANVLKLNVYTDPEYMKPGEKVAIDMSALNLAQRVFGCQAVLNFSSAYFNANPTGPNAPIVAAGGGIWNELIYSIWDTGGDLDVAVGVDINSPVGTKADGTVAKFTLTAEANEGTTKMVFRTDGNDVNSTFFSDANAQAVYPGSKINSQTIVIDGTAPTASFTATQNTLNVKTGSSSATTPVTIQGTVEITVNASDAPAGLKATNPVTVTIEGGVAVGAVSEPTPGVFTCAAVIETTTTNGSHKITVTVTDKADNVTTLTDWIYVNKNKITGQVQLEGFVGGTRAVSFSINGTAPVAKTLTFTGDTAPYVLTDVPDVVTTLSAKTAWNLRQRLSFSLDTDGQATDKNFTLLGGDLNGSNTTNILDYAILKANYLTANPVADITGNGMVNTLDYAILQKNFFKAGDVQ